MLMVRLLHVFRSMPLTMFSTLRCLLGFLVMRWPVGRGFALNRACGNDSPAKLCESQHGIQKGLLVTSGRW
eukprot:1240323-Karenia_brevis.AAC.1